MEDDFYASIKLRTGEEIFARVLPQDEDGDNIKLIITNPIIITSYKSRNEIEGYKIESWMKTTQEDMFIIKMSDIITITESDDDKMIMLHQSYIKKINNFKNSNNSSTSRKMGYIANVSDAKELLEKIYKNS